MDFYGGWKVLKKNYKIFIMGLSCVLILGVIAYKHQITKLKDTYFGKSATNVVTIKSNNVNTDRIQIKNDRDNNIRIYDNNEQGCITIDEAQNVVVKFCRKPNIGAQAFHNDKLDIKLYGIKYYYFDVAYGLMMGDRPKAEDNAITRVFVNSKDKSIFEILESSDKKLSIGKKLTGN